MKGFLILALAMVAMCHDKNAPLITRDLIATLDITPKLWEHTTYEENIFKDWTVGQFEYTLGGQMVAPHYYDYIDYDSPVEAGNFDARTKWTQCEFTIRNQEQCGSCWDFSATEVLQDRLCINDGFHTLLGPQYQLDCDGEDYGCQGGYVTRDFDFLYKVGAVTETCDPYLAKDTGSCPTKCKDGKPMVHYKCKTPEFKIRSITTMQATIEQFGPLQTGFSVYSDFSAYKSGIYHHTSGYYRGGHAVKVIGFGETSGVKYWLVANSWGTAWGMSGFFMIQQGDCGIDSVMTGCGQHA